MISCSIASYIATSLLARGFSLTFFLSARSWGCDVPPYYPNHLLLIFVPCEMVKYESIYFIEEYSSRFLNFDESHVSHSH